MAKKKKKMKKKKKSTSPEQKKEAQRILTIWRNAAKVGLGGKRFDTKVTNLYEPRLLKTILSRLGKNDVFDRTVEAATKAVAHDTGLVCALMTKKGSPVKKDTFQKVFTLMRIHPSCPRKKVKARGTWCDIQL